MTLPTAQPSAWLGSLPLCPLWPVPYLTHPFLLQEFWGSQLTFSQTNEKKNEGLLVTSSKPADLYSWVLFPLFTAHFPTPTFTFQPTRVWLLPSPTPTKLPPTKVSVVSMPLSPAGTSCHSFGPLGTSHPAPVSITLCSVGHTLLAASPPNPFSAGISGLCAGSPTQLCSWGRASSPVAPNTTSLRRISMSVAPAQDA